MRFVKLKYLNLIFQRIQNFLINWDFKVSLQILKMFPCVIDVSMVRILLGAVSSKLLLFYSNSRQMWNKHWTSKPKNGSLVKKSTF